MTKLVVRHASVDGLKDDMGYDDDGWERLDLWIPKNHRPVNIVLTLAIGTIEGKGADYFYLSIRTPEVTEKKDSSWKPKYTLYVDDFDWPKIKAEIVDRVTSCTANILDESLKILRQNFTGSTRKHPRRSRNRLE
jgi:Immunity protein 8